MIRRTNQERQKVIDMTDLFTLMKLSNRPEFRENHALHSNMLNTKGGEFRKLVEYLKNGKKDIDLIKPYSDEILHKYGEFISYACGGKIPFDPMDNVIFFEAPEDEKISDIPLVYNPKDKTININVNSEAKGEMFVFAAILRYVHSDGYQLNGNRYIKYGFFNTEYNLNNLCTKCENKALYEGFIRLISADIIRSVTGEEPQYITKPTVTCSNPEELMEIAQLMRDFANTNEVEEMSDSRYDPRKDALPFDFFVSQKIDATKREVDSKCEEIKFDEIGREIETVALIEGREFERRLSNIIDVLVWMNEEKKF